ncbi:MAG: hypothetical protein LBL63_04375, partial [Clostridiales Family XIII bacterium]|nr:hypothetical protein [Clostridiales Family XIII bacterium]
MKRGDVSAAIRHDLLRALRENIALAVCGCFVLLILIPFSTAAIPGDSVFDVSVTHEQMKFRFIADGFVPAVLIAAVLFGFLFGIASFRFVLDSGRAQTLFSFGISRVRLCFNRFASGAVLIAAAIFVPMTVSLALNLAALGNYPGLFTAWIWLWAGLFVTATAAFCVASIGCLLAGTLPEALFFGAALYAGPYAISYAAGVFLKQLLWGNPFGVAPYLGPGPLAPSATELFSFLNPALFFYDDLASHRMFYRPLETDIPDPISPAVLLAWIAATVVLALLALRLMRRRRAEQAGFAWKCPAALHVCAFVPTVFAGAFVFGLAADASLLFGVALGLVVVALCFLLTQRPLASAGAASFRFLPVAVKIALILLLAVGAKVGYGSYLSLPSIGNVASVDVSYVGAPNALAVPAYGSSSSTDYYFSASYTYTSDSDVERSLDAHRAFAETGRRAL